MRVSRSVLVGSVLVTSLALVVVTVVALPHTRDGSGSAPRPAHAGVARGPIATGARRTLALAPESATEYANEVRISDEVATEGAPIFGSSRSEASAPDELASAPDDPARSPRRNDDLLRIVQPKHVQKISALHGEFPDTLVVGGTFGRGLRRIEGFPGLLAVCAPNEGAGTSGILWLLFLDERGIATRVERVSMDEHPFAVTSFSRDGHGTRELAVGCPNSVREQRVVLLRFDEDWRLREREVLQPGDGILPASRGRPAPSFGTSLVGWWTQEAEPRAQLAVGVPQEARNGPAGDGYVAFLERWRGPFRLMRWLGPGAPGMSEDDGTDDGFGGHLDSCVVGGERLLVVGSCRSPRDATWILSLDEIGQIVRARAWPGSRFDWGGLAVRPVGSSRIQVAVGDRPRSLPYAREILLLTGFPDRAPQTARRILYPGDDVEEGWRASFGRSIAWLDDLDGSGLPELAVGAPFATTTAARTPGALDPLLLRTHAVP